MKIDKYTKLLSSVALVAAMGFTQSILASEHEAKCKAHIQGKIAWDPTSNYESASKWEELNLETICKGTTNPTAPGDCFHKVMTGHVSYGTSDKWEWRNAVKLCAGTSDADKPINCFKEKIAAGRVGWEAAIDECKVKMNIQNLQNIAE